MQIDLSTKTIINNLLPLQSVINSNNAVPILKEVLIEFSKKKLSMTGENLEVNCTKSVNLTSKIKASFCVNYQDLVSTLKTIEDSFFRMDIYDNQITITHKKGSFNLPISDSSAFPQSELSDMNMSSELDSKTFKGALKTATRFCASDDIDVMSSVSISFGKKSLIRATDRFRLYEEKIKGKGDSSDILLSGKGASSLVNLLGNSSDFELVYNEDKVCFSYPGTSISVVQQKGAFPIAAFSNILSTVKESKKIKVDVPELIKMIKRVSVLSSNSSSMCVKFSIMKNELFATCDNVDYATKSQETIAIDSKLNLDVNYNFKHLIDVLSVFSSEAELSIGENNILFISEGKKTGATSPILI